MTRAVTRSPPSPADGQAALTDSAAAAPGKGHRVDGIQPRTPWVNRAGPSRLTSHPAGKEGTRIPEPSSSRRERSQPEQPESSVFLKPAGQETAEEMSGCKWCSCTAEKDVWRERLVRDQLTERRVPGSRRATDRGGGGAAKQRALVSRQHLGSFPGGRDPTTHRLPACPS